MYSAVTQHLLSVYHNILNPTKYRLSTEVMLGYDTIEMDFFTHQICFRVQPNLLTTNYF